MAVTRRHDRTHPNIIIHVRREDISCGARGSKNSCAIANAIARELILGEENNISVGIDTSVIGKGGVPWAAWDVFEYASNRWRHYTGLLEPAPLAHDLITHNDTEDSPSVRKKLLKAIPDSGFTLRISEIRDRYKQTGPSETVLKKRAARSAVSRAVKDGSLVKPSTCNRCSTAETPGAVRLEAHHDDYDFPLDVEWVCEGCHREEHSTRKRAQRGPRRTQRRFGLKD